MALTSAVGKILPSCDPAFLQFRMTNWQRRARFVIAAAAVAFAIVVAFAIKRRTPQPAPAPAVRTDPGAVVEVTGGRVERFKLSREDVRVEYERQLTYANGSTKLMGVTI